MNPATTAIEVLPEATHRGAVEMARFWVRNPDRVMETEPDQLARELLTISRALTALARRVEGS